MHEAWGNDDFVWHVQLVLVNKPLPYDDCPLLLVASQLCPKIVFRDAVHLLIPPLRIESVPPDAVRFVFPVQALEGDAPSPPVVPVVLGQHPGVDCTPRHGLPEAGVLDCLRPARPHILAGYRRWRRSPEEAL
ncbi:hypothetical protein PG996_004920 [Apiospora saccharicola]|uniref:Uncharacterized protein n=1 Tax=Apiospora saccharicola TaxID=335842 RepID=A0ABR1VL44_9PEZI